MAAAQLCARVGRSRLGRWVEELAAVEESYAQRLARAVSELYAIECSDYRETEKALDQAVAQLRLLLGELLHRNDVPSEARLELVATLKTLYPTMMELSRFVHPHVAKSSTPLARLNKPVLELMPEEGDRRDTSRLALSAELAIVDGNRFLSGVVSDISRGGLFVITDDLCEVGTLIVISFLLPSHASIEARCRVRWCNAVTDESQDLARGMGLEFLDIEATQADALADFIERS